MAMGRCQNPPQMSTTPCSCLLLRGEGGEEGMDAGSVGMGVAKEGDSNWTPGPMRFFDGCLSSNSKNTEQYSKVLKLDYTNHSNRDQNNE